MTLVTLFIVVLPLAALLWAILGVFVHRRELRAQELLSVLGALLMFPLGILFIGVLEVGPGWLLSFPGVVFGSVFVTGAILFGRAEVLKRRDRGRPAWACQNCGYDRRGISGPCPECGAEQRKVIERGQPVD